MTKEEFINMIKSEIKKLKSRKEFLIRKKTLSKTLYDNYDINYTLTRKELEDINQELKIINNTIKKLNNLIEYPIIAAIRAASEEELEAYKERLINKLKEKNKDLKEELKLATKKIPELENELNLFLEKNNICNKSILEANI